MANERITPFVKRLRTNGGTFYSFSSSIEDIGLNINERNNIVKISHFALLDIPDIKSTTTGPEYDENYFNVTAIAGAWEYENTGANIKDGRILIAESFQNYALNLENTMLNSSNYNPALTSTISERVFWKWLKETGAIRWTRDFSTGYWTEEEDADGTAGYNKVVKYLGEITAGNVRQDAFGTFNETYVLIPTSHGQTRIYFQQQEDDNYQHGLTFQNGTENILGRQSYTKPHPDGLSYRAYYDFVDSSTMTGAYAMTYDPSTGVDTPGWWYSYYGLNPSGDNWYIIDYDDYLDTSIFTQILEYNDGSDQIRFKRSNVDCISVVKDLDTLKTIFGDTALTYDRTAIEYSINDNFTFNSVLVYYTVYNETGDTVLARNLLGILFLDAPEGNSSQISLDGITIPSLEKIASTVTGFGTSYSFKLNIKTENILDDTAAVIVDKSTSSQTPLEEFMDVFYNLERSVEILQKHTGTINYISQQNQNISNIQSQQQELLQQLNEQVQDTVQDITGTSNTLAMFASGSDPLVDSSVYMSLGKIGIFTKTPQYPVQIDASIKTKDIFIENAIRDTSGNILLGYGSPLQINSIEAGRDVSIFGQVNVDGSIHVKGNIDIDGSLFFAGIAFDPSTTGGSVDGSVGIYDSSLSSSLEMLNDVGGITAGTTVGDLVGKSYNELWDELLFPTINPTYSSVGLSLSDNAANYIEVGTTINPYTLTPSFNRGQILLNSVFQDFRAGEASTYTYDGPDASLPITTTSSSLSISYDVTVGTQQFTVSVLHDEGPQPLDSKGNPYGSPLPQGTIGPAGISFEGVYPLFATSSNITTLTKQSLVSMLTGDEIVISLVSEDGVNKQKFQIPDPWTGAPTNRPLTDVETFNSLSGNYESTGLGQWNTSSTTQTIQGNVINYTEYTYNGSTRGDINIRLIF